MQVQHKINKGKAQVDDGLGQKLIDGGLWVAYSPPKKAPEGTALKAVSAVAE
jgi:hypothetical protein